MADDKLPCWRSESIDATRSDNVNSRPPAISLRHFQNASSRLTLVLCPAMTIDRLTTGDFISDLHVRSCADQVSFESACGWPLSHRAPSWKHHAQACFPQPSALLC